MNYSTFDIFSDFTENTYLLMKQVLIAELLLVMEPFHFIIGISTFTPL